MGKITIVDDVDSDQYRWLLAKGEEYCLVDGSLGITAADFAREQAEVFLGIYRAERQAAKANYNLVEDRKVSALALVWI